MAVPTVFAVGLAVGLLSGLVGIGGGVLIVPFLYFYYAHPEWFGVVVDPGTATVVAHATSLFVIVPTSIRGVLAFHRAELVVWRAVWPIGLASVAAAVVGARLAVLLPPAALKAIFGTLLLISGARLAVRRAPEPEDRRRRLRLSLPTTLSIGGILGVFSAMLGVGGGVLSIPLLVHVVGIRLQQVAATSIAIVTITAVAGTLTYVVTGFGAAGRPPASLGYVDLAAGVVMFLGSLLSVRWGTVLNQRLNPRGLSLVFAVLFLAIGTQLILENLGVL